MTARERARFDAQVRDLRAIESDDTFTGAQLDRLIETVNADRAQSGIPPLRAEEHPEEELYRRARALGLRHRRR